MSETELKLILVANRMNAVMSRPLRSDLIGRNGYVPEAEESEDVEGRQVALLVAGFDWPELKERRRQIMTIWGDDLTWLYTGGSVGLLQLVRYLTVCVRAGPKFRFLARQGNPTSISV